MHRFRLPFGLACSACVVSVFLTACVTTAPVSPEWVQCLARADRFVTVDRDMVLDTCTQMVWMAQDYRNIEGKAPTRWTQALDWVNHINQQRYGGHNDWRAATLEDYEVIYHPHRLRRSHRGKPVGYPDAFVDGGGEWCWVKEIADLSDIHVHQAFTFSFRTGEARSKWFHSTEHPQHENVTGSIRLVRGPIAGSLTPAAK